MSEFHPNRTTPVRTRPKLTARRIFECWPLLIWVGMAVVAVWIYREGVTFKRMNGAVDVYQENITPIEDGRLKEIKVRRGQRVDPGTVVAVMDTAPYDLEMETLRREYVADRVKEIREYDLEIIKLDSELREIETAMAEDGAVKTELGKILDALSKGPASKDPLAQLIRNSQTDSVRSQVELAKATGRLHYNEPHLTSIKEAIKTATDTRDTLKKEAAALAKLDMTAGDVAKSEMLRPEEQQEYTEVKAKIDGCRLTTAHGGIVDRVAKEVSEYVKVGEGVLKIVGDPEQIIAFLPQDQSSQLKVGDKVWVTATSDLGKDYISEVVDVSPRINNLADATSPLPNQRVHGRDVIIKYPQDAMPKNGKGFLLLPGQTVIVQVEKPGNVPLLNRIFPSDDSGHVH